MRNPRKLSKNNRWVAQGRAGDLSLAGDSAVLPVLLGFAVNAKIAARESMFLEDLAVRAKATLLIDLQF